MGGTPVRGEAVLAASPGGLDSPSGGSAGGPSRRGERVGEEEDVGREEEGGGEIGEEEEEMYGQLTKLFFKIGSGKLSPSKEETAHVKVRKRVKKLKKAYAKMTLEERRAHTARLAACQKSVSQKLGSEGEGATFSLGVLDDLNQALATTATRDGGGATSPSLEVVVTLADEDDEGGASTPPRSRSGLGAGRGAMGSPGSPSAVDQKSSIRTRLPKELDAAHARVESMHEQSATLTAQELGVHDEHHEHVSSGKNDANVASALGDSLVTHATNVRDHHEVKLDILQARTSALAKHRSKLRDKQKKALIEPLEEEIGLVRNDIAARKAVLASTAHDRHARVSSKVMETLERQLAELHYQKEILESEPHAGASRTIAARQKRGRGSRGNSQREADALKAAKTRHYEGLAGQTHVRLQKLRQEQAVLKEGLEAVGHDELGSEEHQEKTEALAKLRDEIKGLERKLVFFQSIGLDEAGQRKELSAANTRLRELQEERNTFTGTEEERDALEQELDVVRFKVITLAKECQLDTEEAEAALDEQLLDRLMELNQKEKELRAQVRANPEDPHAERALEHVLREKSVVHADRKLLDHELRCMPKTQQGKRMKIKVLREYLQESEIEQRQLEYELADYETRLARVGGSNPAVSEAVLLRQGETETSLVRLRAQRDSATAQVRRLTAALAAHSAGNDSLLTVSSMIKRNSNVVGNDEGSDSVSMDEDELMDSLAADASPGYLAKLRAYAKARSEKESPTRSPRNAASPENAYVAAKNVARYQRTFDGGKHRSRWKALLHEEDSLQVSMVEIQEEESALQEKEVKLVARFADVDNESKEETAALNEQDHGLTLEKKRLDERTAEIEAEEARLETKVGAVDQLKMKMPSISPEEKPRLRAMITQAENEARKVEHQVRSAREALDEWTNDLRIRKRKVLDRREVISSKAVTMRHELLKVQQKQHRLKGRKYDLEEQGLELETEKLDVELAYNEEAMASVEGALEALKVRKTNAENALSTIGSDDPAAKRTLEVELDVATRDIRISEKQLDELYHIREHLQTRIEETKQHFSRLERARRRWARKNAKFHEKERELMEFLRNKGQNQIQLILQAVWEMGGLHPFVALSTLELSSLDWFVYDQFE